MDLISNLLQRTLTNLTLRDSDSATSTASWETVSTDHNPFPTQDDEDNCITPHEGTIIKFARFVDGSLELFKSPIGETDYIAFSHVWGAWTWRDIQGIPYAVKASQEKADFIATDLPRLVGDGAFWMDTLTVDQRDEGEIAAIVDTIPLIFRLASKTVAVRECDGLYDCCMAAVEGFIDHGDFQKKLYAHSRTHSRFLCAESYLQRLWTLQECLLSHTIEFYVGSGNVPKTKAVRRPDDLDFYASQNDIVRLADSLWVLAYCVSGADGEAGVTAFMKAYTHCGTVVNSKSPLRSQHEDIHDGYFLHVNLASHRSATMPRDYIFATMPAFPWYRYPKREATIWSFSEIYSDLFQQAARNDHAFTCRFTRSMLEPTCTDPLDGWLPSLHLPSPTTLGDFMKLLGHRIPAPSNLYSPNVHVTSSVQVFEFDMHDTAESVIHALEHSMTHFVQQWQESHRGGELSKFGNFPDDDWTLDDLDAKQCGWFHHDEGIQQHVAPSPYSPDSDDDDDIKRLTWRPSLIYYENPVLQDDLDLNDIETQARALETSGATTLPLFVYARQILDHLWCARDRRHVNQGQARDWMIFTHKMRSRWSAPLLRSMLLLGAMLNCRVPLSAAAWVNKQFVPVYIRYSETFTTLGLLARHARLPADERGPARMLPLLSVGQHPVQMRVFGGSTHVGKDLFLVHPDTLVPVGLVPDFLAGEYEEAERRALMRVLYRDCTTVIDDEYAFMQMRPLSEFAMGARVDGTV